VKVVLNLWFPQNVRNLLTRLASQEGPYFMELVSQKTKNFSSIAEPFMENCYSQVILFPSVLTYAVYVVMSHKHDTCTVTLTTGNG
jgi:hypothetical protein